MTSESAWSGFGQSETRSDTGWREATARKCTKIVATLGPASSSDEVVHRLIEAGVDVFRLNFSHGTHDTHRANLDRIRRLAREDERNIAVLQDIQGPKIRIGEVKDGEVVLRAGQTFVLTPHEVEADDTKAYVSYPRLADDISIGDRILIDDGKLELQVMAAEGHDLVTRVLVGGSLKPHKGVNFPGAALRISVLTEKDKADLKFGAEIGVDLVAASFVQTPHDVLEVKEFLLQ